MNTRFLNVPQTAEALGVTVGRVRPLLRSGGLRGIKINQRAWAIEPKEVERAAVLRHRPRK